MASITGTITDAITGSPIENATVIIGDSLAFSNENGEFTINSPIGRQRLVVIQRYYKKIKDFVELGEGSTITIRMERD